MLQEAVWYGNLLKKLRTEKNVAQDVLGEGLYSQNLMGKVERGERYPEKQVRDRLLARLGESGYDYECFLQPEEYDGWEARRDILDSLDDRELDKAEQLMEEYEIKYAGSNPVAHQFVLAMRIQWMEIKGTNKEERGRLLEEAVKLTIPEIDTKPLHRLLLSAQELNLVLEYQAYRHPETLQNYCMQMIEYLDKRDYDDENKAKLLAKTALFFCNSKPWITESSYGILDQLQWVQSALKICTDGIEALRDKSKLYFAMELLQKKVQYLGWLLEQETLFTEKEMVQYKEGFVQTKEFYQLFGTLYERFQVPKETNGFTCFYREHEVYCLNAVIRARRRMLEITAEELEQQLLCSKRTLVRLEARKTKVQWEVAQGLFSYLNLSPELHRAQIITDRQEALRLEEQFRWAQDQRDYAEARLLLQRLKELIPLTELINRQYIQYSEMRLAYDMGKLSKEEYLQQAKEALELTIPLEMAMAEIKDRKLPNGKLWFGEKYLTNMEVTILENIAYAYGDSMDNQYWKGLNEYFEWLEKKCTLTPILSMYGYVMGSVASWLGNTQRYEASSNINRKIMQELLRQRNLCYAHRNLYDLLWNDRKQKGLPMTKEDPEWRNGLLECLTVDAFCKDEWREKSVREKIKK